MSIKKKITVVGPGLIGKVHIRVIQESQGAELVSIVAPDHAENHEIARACRVPLFHSIENSLKSVRVDGVIVSSPNEFHFEQGRLCIEAGIPVLIEKPITPNLVEARALVDLARTSGAKVLVGHHRAHSPILEVARQAISQGRLGRLVSIIGSAQFIKPRGYFLDGPWRTQPGGGPILINLIHEIGNFRTLVGEISSVHAFASSTVRGYPVEDTAAINFIFKSGALGTFMLSDTAATSKSWEQTSGENPRFPSYSDDDCYLVAGTKGSLSIPTMRLRSFMRETEPSWWTPFDEEVLAVDRADPLKCQIDHFVRVIAGEEAPLVSAADGYQNLKVVEAIRRSVAERVAIDVEE